MKTGIQSLLVTTWFFFFSTAFALDPNSEKNQKWWAGEEIYTIKLQGEMLLSDILDAGIKPRHVGGMGGHLLQFQSKSVTFVFTNGGEIKTKNGYGELYVGSDHRIMNVTFYENYDTGIDEALERLLDVRSLFDGGGRSVEELTDRINEVRNAEGHWVDRPFGLGKKNIDDYWGGSVVAGRSHDKQLPFRFITTVIRNYKDREKDRPDRNPMGVLLEPPEGYEHISFEYVTTPTDPNATPIPYLSPLEQAQKLTENLEKRQEALESEAPAPQFTPTAEPDTDKKLPYDKPSRRIYAVILLIVVLSLASYFAIRRLKRE